MLKITACIKLEIKEDKICPFYRQTITKENPVEMLYLTDEDGLHGRKYLISLITSNSRLCKEVSNIM